MDSKTYWSHREAAQLRKNVKDELEYNKKIKETYDYMLDNIQKEINGFYARYAAKEGISLSEAKKRVSQLDIDAYGRKAKRYVKDKTFTKEANEEMRLYNATMKINRLELLKANIGLELVDGFDELQKYFDTTLTDRTLSEFKRQAGILGKSVLDNEKAAHSIVNASYQNAKFSDRIWMYQDMLKAELSSQLKIGLIQGRNPRELASHISKAFGVSRNNAERLMQTELARVQTEAQKQSYERNGYDQYEFVAEPTACPICQALDGKIFYVKKMLPGENASPIHPNCRCSTAAHMDREEFDKWLDFIDKGGTTEEWNKIKAKVVVKSAKSGKIKLPRYQEAVIPEAKLQQYVLNSDRDPNKARVFKTALGYTMSNAAELIQQIRDKLPDYEATEKGDRGWGMTYEVIMDITGPNGKTAKVLTAWIDDKDNGEMRLTTVHVD
jgi:SPP1 gp7 family putative phage head morphogenesis protein